MTRHPAGGDRPEGFVGGGGDSSPAGLLVGSFAAGVPLLTAGIVVQGWLRQRQRVAASRGFEVVPAADRSPPA